MIAFRRWLKQQEGRNDPVGDLAGDVARDHGLIRANQSLNELYSWLRINGACQGALQSLIEAYREWQTSGNTYRQTRDRPRQLMSPRMRFLILKRDSYRCQLCGRSAQDNVILEIDHKIAVSRGGSDEESNLWTLCFTCNRGKHNDSL